MATTYTSSAAAATAPAPATGGPVCGVTTATYEVATALIIDDIIEMVRLPAGAVVLDVMGVFDDLDTGVALTLDVGITVTDPNYWISASTVGQAGGVARADTITAHPYTMTVEDTIDIHVAAAPTGGGVGTVSLTVWFKTD